MRRRSAAAALTSLRSHTVSVILLQDLENWGFAGDEINVKAGFARNYLIGRKAVYATEENRKLYKGTKSVSNVVLALHCRRAAVPALTARWLRADDAQEEHAKALAEERRRKRVQKRLSSIAFSFKRQTLEDKATLKSCVACVPRAVRIMQPAERDAWRRAGRTMWRSFCARSTTSTSLSTASACQTARTSKQWGSTSLKWSP